MQSSTPVASDVARNGKETKAPGMCKVHYILVILLQAASVHRFQMLKKSYGIFLLVLLYILVQGLPLRSEESGKIPVSETSLAHYSEMIDKAWGYLSQNRDSVIFYLNKAEGIVDFSDSEVKADYYNALGIYYWQVGKAAKGIHTFRETLKMDPEKVNITQQVVAHNNLGMLLSNIGQMTEARQNLEKALELDELRENYSGAAKSMYDLSRLYHQMGYNELALEYIQKTVAIQQELDETFRLIRSLNMLGNIYYDTDQSDLAVTVYKESLSLADRNHDTPAMAIAFNNISGVFSEIVGKFDSAIYYAEKGLELARQSNNRELISILNTNIAKAYNVTGDTEKALFFFKKSLSDFEFLRSESMRSEILLSLSAVYMAIAKYDSANYYLDRAIRIAEPANIWPVQEKVFMRKAKIDSINNRLDDYIVHFHKGLAIRDSLQRKSNQARIAELMIIHEVELKSAEIEILTKENKWHRTMMLINFMVSLFFIISLLFAVMFFRNRKTIAHQKLQVQMKESQRYKAHTDTLVLEARLKEEEMERRQLEAGMREQEMIYSSLKQANLLMINKSIKEKLGVFQYAIVRKKDQEAFVEALESLSRDAIRDPLSDFEQMFVQMHNGFYEKLLESDEGFSRSELQMCALLRMNLPSKEIANMLNLSVSRVDQTRHQIRKRLNLEANQNLTSYLILL